MSWSMQSLPDFTDEDFERWRKLLEERSGIHLVPQQRTFLKSQLSIRIRELGGITPDEYYNQLRDGVRGMVEWSNLLDRLVVKETSFFRHIPSFDFIRSQILHKISAGEIGSSFDVWSVGCATGEEPYSLAMLLNETFTFAGADVFWGIQATDISLQALNYGRKGIYPLRKAEMVEKDIRDKYFEVLDQHRCQIVPSLRERVCFTHGNATELKKLPMVKMDLISCNNMLIYFRRWRRRKILNDMVDRLKPGGILLIGLGEIVDWKNPHVELIRDESVQAYVRVD